VVDDVASTRYTLWQMTRRAPVHHLVDDVARTDTRLACVLDQEPCHGLVDDGGEVQGLGFRVP